MQPLTINQDKEPVLRRHGRIVPVDPSNLSDAAAVHALAWQASHQAFCSPDFIQLHTPERQAGYLKSKLDTGSKIYLLLTDEPVGIVSVTEARSKICMCFRTGKTWDTERSCCNLP